MSPVSRWFVPIVTLAGLGTACGEAPLPAGDAEETVGAQDLLDEDLLDEADAAPHADLEEDAPEVAGDAEPSEPPECGPGAMSPFDDPCDDFDPCTLGLCVAGRCEQEPVDGCCRQHADCDDGIACTEDRCVRNRCQFTRGDSFCCVDASDCEDFDPCTEEICAANRCVYPLRPSCTVPNPASCEDQNPCTAARWSADGRCTYETRESPPEGEACCELAADCGDGDADGVFQCQQSRCWQGASSCMGDGDCAGPGPCSAGTCADGRCVYPDPASCCESDAACDDGLVETTDRCVDSRCVNALVERRCSEDAMCPAPNPCVATRCVSGYCDARPVDGPGCCRQAADCQATGRCSRVSCESFACLETPVDEDTPFWRADFADLEGWEVDADASGARWRTSSQQFITAPASLHYATEAGGFDVGHTFGGVTSPPVTLPAGLASETLRVAFWRNLRVESISSRDLVELHVLPAGGGELLLWDKGFGDGPGIVWREDSVSLPAGLTGELRLRFRFDTVDGINNDGQGVFIDALRLLAPCPADE